MEALIEQILAKLSDLSEPRLREVLRFVDHIKQSSPTLEKNDSSEEPLLAIAGMLSGEPLSAQEIEAELETETLYRICRDDPIILDDHGISEVLNKQLAGAFD